MKLINSKKNRGFTLVEMLVSLSIAGIIMSVVLFNYSTFTDELAVSSAAQEVAIAIRQAQTYGLTVKEVVASGGNFDSGYGVYFDKMADNYIIFADKNRNGYYDVGTDCGTSLATTECVEKIFLRNKVIIRQLCSELGCPPNSSEYLHITFLRPNPDALILWTNPSGLPSSGPSTLGKIMLISPKGKYYSIVVQPTSQVLVMQNY